MLCITADSRYRARLNGVWINDGPGRAYPEHWTYDEYDILSRLRNGPNFLEVTARYYGIGTFHQIPQQAGLLAEIDLDGEVIGTDSSWQSAPLRALHRWSPKVGIQMEPAESVDAGLLTALDWKPSKEWFAADDGPWQDLTPRRSEPLTQRHCRPVGLRSALRLKPSPGRVCVPVTQIAHPGRIEANIHTSRPVVLAAVLTLKQAATLNFRDENWRVAINGALPEGAITLPSGQHAVLFFCNAFYGHKKELPFPFIGLAGTEWGSWRVFVNETFLFHDDDLVWIDFPNERAASTRRGWLAAIEESARGWKSPSEPLPELGKEVKLVAEQLFMEDYSADFAARSPSGAADVAIVNGEGVCRDHEGVTGIHPLTGADVELCYDLGEQRCGYLAFSIKARAGTLLDFHLVEYITPEGVVQHTAEFNRNGMRYLAAEGVNDYLSLKRRSGRYLFLTFRNLISPVELIKLEMVESTAAVEPAAVFSCSDSGLNRIWEACERTLKMGMEDTFTDCPLYEQTLWIGDARNQALYASAIYGKAAVAHRSFELGGQSLARFPIVGCQVPSCWECLIPAWSFLWGIGVWEHYFYSGDKAFLTEMFPLVMKNLQGAFGYLDQHGLFSGTFWNLLEWAEIDQNHSTVLHNSLLLAWACRHAEYGAETLGEAHALDWLRPRRQQLMAAIGRWWDPVKKSYPDAILEDGRPSPKTCQHNSVLAVLAGAVPPGGADDIRTNLVRLPAGMTPIASPFAAQFLFEALELIDEPAAIMDSVRRHYTPMIEAGATTVWETYPGSTCSPDGFPTRSHCHAVRPPPRMGRCMSNGVSKRPSFTCKFQPRPGPESPLKQIPASMG